MSKVSIIIPAYNVEGVLSSCLESIINQSFTDMEIIVVNDGSTDNTQYIIEKYVKLDKRVKAVWQKNKGVSAARNRALGIATGEFIIFVDSDDVVTEEYVSELLRWSEYDFVTAGYHYQTPDGIWCDRIYEDIIAMQRDVRENPSKFWGKYYFGSPWAILMRRAIIENNKLRFDEEVHCGEDTLFILQYLLYASTIKIIPMCGYKYFYYKGSLINSNHFDMWRWKITIEKELEKFFVPQKWEEKEYLLVRKFNVLSSLLQECYGVVKKDEFLKIYENPIFEDAKNYKLTNGQFLEKMLLFSMKHKKYIIFKNTKKLCEILNRIKGKIERTFKR